MARTKSAKKQWYQIEAPKMFNGAVLGETHVFEEQAMVGKGISANLMALTGDIKRQNVKVSFSITGVNQGKAQTKITGYNIIPASVKRMVRRSVDKIGMSFTVKTKDGVHVRMKPLLVTRATTKGSITTRMRREAQNFLVRYANNVSADNLFNDLINKKVQMELRNYLKKVYPLRAAEIRSLSIVTGKKIGKVATEIEVGVAQEEAADEEADEPAAEEQQEAAEEKAPEAEEKPTEEAPATEDSEKESKE